VLLLLVIVCVLALIIYKLPFFNNTFILGKKINLTQGLFLTVFPALAVLCIGLIFVEILYRPFTSIIPIQDATFIIMVFVLMLMLGIGLGIHTFSKIVSLYLTNKKSVFYKENEFFHGPVSHLAFNLAVLVLVFVLALFELNHPSLDQIVVIQQVIIGLILGVCYVLGIFFYVHSRRFVLFFLGVSVIQSIVLFLLKGDILFYPYFTMLLSANICISVLLGVMAVVEFLGKA